MTAILNGMENKGYIKRKTADSNRRSLHVYLTESGKKYADRLNLEFARIESQALEGFTPGRKATITGLARSRI